MDFADRRDELAREVRRHVGEYVAILDEQILVADADPAVVIAWLRANDVRGSAMYLVPEGEIGDFGEHGLVDSQ